MRYLHCTFEQAVAAYGWCELVNFSRHLPDDSATVRAADKETALFARQIQQSALLADIYDAIVMLAYTVAKAYGGKGKPPKPYQRPWDAGNAQKLGKGAIPISEFDNWYYGGD